MGGDWLQKRDRLLQTMVLTIALGFVLEALALGQVQQSGEGSGSPSGQAAAAEQAAPADSPGARVKTPVSSTGQQVARGKMPPPSVLERSELVAAARQSAVDGLLRLVESERIDAGLTVGQLLDALPLSAQVAFAESLRSTPQIGGARFPTAGTVEVQLQAEGGLVLQTLVALVREAEAASPVPADELERRLVGWRGRTFSANGGSASSVIGPELRVRPENLPPEWARVSEEARRSAFLQARENAVSQFIEAIRPIELSQDASRRSQSTDAVDGIDQGEHAPLTIRTALEKEGVEHDAREWLSRRPLCQMKFAEGRYLEVKLAVEPADWVQQLRVSLSRPELGLPDITEQDWERVTATVARLLETEGAVGKARVLESEPPASAALLPSRAPEWTTQNLTVKASAAAVGGGGSPARRRLLTQQAAFEAAQVLLRSRLEALPLGDGQTLGDLANSSPPARDLLEAFVQGSRIAHTEYQADGSATVEISLAPQNLWHALQRRLVATAATAPD